MASDSLPTENDLAIKNGNCVCGFKNSDKVCEPCDHFIPDCDDHRDCADCGHREACHVNP